MAFSWFSCKALGPCNESDPNQHMEIETPVSPVRKHKENVQDKENVQHKENVQTRQSTQQNAKEAAKPALSDKLLSREEDEAARKRAEKEKTTQKEKEAKEAEKRKKQAQKEAREKAEREAKAEQKRAAEERKKEDEAKQAAARLQKLGPLGRTGAKLQVELETGWADCGEDEFKQICDHVAGGGAKFAIQARGVMYCIDWSDPNAATQKNVQSGKTRKLRVI